MRNSLNLRVRGSISLRGGLATLILAAQSLFSPAVAGPAEIGEWSAPFNINVKGIHSQVLPTGKVLLFSYPRTGQIGSSAFLWDPSSGASTDVTVSYLRDAFCSGQNLLPDGRVFATGGHLPGPNHEDAAGVYETDIFDPITQSWSSGPSLTEGRWYPTNLELGDGRVLIFSGQENKTTHTPTVDSYDPATNTITQLPETATKWIQLYPHLDLLPSGKVFLSGPQKGTQLFNPATNTWSWVGNMQFGGRSNGNSVLLPGLNRVLALGGNNATAGVTSTAEIIDLSASRPKWRFTAPMNFARRHPNTVLLPNGKALVVGGGTSGLYGSPVMHAELFDPVTETWSLMAPQTAPRIYHSTAVLLPDGRVLSAGMDSGTYQFTAELYSPPYLFSGPRPSIASAPFTVGYGAPFEIVTPDASDITRVALIKPGGTTHSISMDQRYVDLSFTPGQEAVTATAPPNGNHAPPGWYMLFILNSSGIPSVASWVHVG